MIFSIGSDPEFILEYKNNLKSAIGLLPSKDECIVQNGHRFYYDNVLAEIAVKPSNNKKEFVENIRESLSCLSELVAPNKLTLLTVGNYPDKELLTEASRIAACLEEWCCYTLNIEEIPADIIRTTSFRTAGGHIHLGSSQVVRDQYLQHFVIKMLDLFLGLPSIFIDKNKNNRYRREVYGQAGRHRRPAHGLEYRSLSNFWLASPTYVELIYDLCDFTLDFVDKKDHLKFWAINEKLLDDDDPSSAYYCYGYDVNLLRTCIDKCDKKSGKKFLEFISNFMPKELFTKIQEAIVFEPSNFTEEWKWN